MIPVRKDAIDRLAAAFSIAPTSLTHFAGGREDNDGIVYAWPADGERKLLKVQAIPLAQMARGLFCLEERLRFARYLGDNGARIVFPLTAPSGRLYESVESGDHVWFAYAMDVAPGATMDSRAWNERFFREWGRTVGSMHRLARAYPSWRSSIDPATGAEYLTWAEELQGFVGMCRDDEVAAAWRAMGQVLEGLPRNRDNFGFIHNDPHIWNLLADGDAITVLDFDVANHHWFMADVAIACQSVLFDIAGGMNRAPVRPDRARDWLALFLDGYARENTLAASDLALLDTFVDYRRLLLFTVMYGWISSDPAQLKAWKDLIASPPRLFASL
jgi:Ser/Thr protein kinase RdoA (MazF antagonist)